MDTITNCSTSSTKNVITLQTVYELASDIGEHFKKLIDYSCTYYTVLSSFSRMNNVATKATAISPVVTRNTLLSELANE